MSGKQETTKLTLEEEAEMEKDLKEFWKTVALLYEHDQFFRLCIDTMGMWAQTYDSLEKKTEDAYEIEMILDGYFTLTSGIKEIICARYSFHQLDIDAILDEIEEKSF